MVFFSNLEYAVAFFLLGDKLSDAVSICLKQLNDPQLAIVLCRLNEGEDSPLLINILSTVIIPESIEKGDRWLLSMSFSILREKSNALMACIVNLD